MTKTPKENHEIPALQQTDFERITQIVRSEFEVEEALIQNGTSTYYLKWPQETKQPFLKLLNKLKELNLIALLRKEDRIVLRVITKPSVKPSNKKIYWAFFIATIVTTFITGYFSFGGTGLNPVLSGIIFSAAIMTVLGLHEMGHKITANRKKVEATSPYFIPGPPPLGTLGAVIMQKSLPPNRDALFDIGANGPLAGFIVALAFSAVGLTLLVPTTIPAGEGLSLMPVSWWYILLPALDYLHLIPPLTGAYNGYSLHPIAWAGWAGMVVTMLNLLPAAMLDGGHVAKSLVPDKLRYILTIASVAVLLLSGTQFLVFAFIVIFMSFLKHPGPLDDVSKVSTSRKILTVILIAAFTLSFPLTV
ncbi:MAG TPA: site-2 protease family protein [Candidatus Sulfotelmatobacter sp.]|nr:site-2 protease family protein [Candidatus Sulfotelmatobacter sp.]